MRLVRPLSSNKENIITLKGPGQGQKPDEMKKELKAAYTQIHLLKQSNQ